MKRLALPLLIAAMLAGSCAQSKVARWAKQEHEQARLDARKLVKRVQRYAPPLHDPQRIAREYGEFAQPLVARTVEGVKADAAYAYHAPGEAARAFKTELDTVQPYLNNSIINVRDWLTDQTIDAHELLIGPVR
jgi:hypothetical protein